MRQASEFLPVDLEEERIVESIRNHTNVILLAEPGAGKSTRVPQMLQKHIGGTFLMVQPRRWAARLVAERIAKEKGEKIGSTVGYQIRFEKVGSPQTSLWVMTEGVLLRKLLQDPELQGISGVILDEFHERSLDVDLTLSLLKETQAVFRPDLKILVMSATLDPVPILDFLPGSTLIEVKGRTFPVHSVFSGKKPVPKILSEMMPRLREYSIDPLDVLVFLPGSREIHEVERELKSSSLGPFQNHRIYPLYASLEDSKQRSVFEDQGRKIILSTNIAETSITLPSVNIVIDSGEVKELRYDLSSGEHRLEKIRISHASSEQRKGRAGRVREGVCVHLWEKADHFALRRSNVPEVHRVNLSQAVLSLGQMGVRDPHGFDWFEKPKKQQLDHAIAELIDLGFWSVESGITEWGLRALRYPLEPRLASVMLKAEDSPSLLNWVAYFCAWMESKTDDIRVTSLEDLNEALHRRKGQYQRVVSDLLRISRTETLPFEKVLSISDTDALRCVLAMGASRFVVEGRKPGGREVFFRTESGAPDVAYLLKSKERTHSGKPVVDADHFIVLDRSILQSYAEKKRVSIFDEREGRVRTYQGLYLGDLLLGEKLEVPSQAKDKEEGLFQFLYRDEYYLIWMRRDPLGENFLNQIEIDHRLHGESGLGAIWDFEGGLRACIQGKTHLSELEVGDYIEHLIQSQGYEFERSWKEKFPEKIQTPAGPFHRIRYEKDRAVLSVRLQEVFGWNETPKLLGGRLPFVMELLSPGYKPIQMTQDLKSFWGNAYFEVRKELKARYPKHSWPEDPLTATAQAKGRPHK